MTQNIRQDAYMWWLCAYLNTFPTLKMPIMVIHNFLLVSIHCALDLSIVAILRQCHNTAVLHKPCIHSLVWSATQALYAVIVVC